MQDFGTKADNSPPPGGQLSAAEFNNLAAENENAVLRSGQALSGASATQLAESLFLHGVKAESFQDSGVANAYVATPVSGASGVLLPTSYTNISGAKILFKASNSNSGASTLNIGQTTGTLLGTKAIVDQGGSPIAAGAIVGGNFVQLIYDPSIGAGSWVLLPWAVSSASVARFTANGTFIVPAGIFTIYVSGTAGGGGGGGGADNSLGQTSFVGGGGGGGGGAGQFLYREAFSVTPLQSISITIGSAGAAGAAGIGAAGGAGGAGGNTVIGSLSTLTGGGGGGGGLRPVANSLPNGGAGAAGGTGFPAGATGTDGNYAGNGGQGASGPYGGGGGSGRAATSVGLAGRAASGFGGGGGGGGAGYGSAAAVNGGGGAVGTAGFVFIEY